MNTKIETNEELKYIMRFLEIKKIELPKNLGRIELNGDALTYVTDGYYQSYKHQYRHLAFEDAIKCINEDMEKLEVWRETAKKTFKTRILDEDRRNLSKTAPIKGYCWTSDFAKSGVTMTKDDEGFMLIEGTASAINVFVAYANEHLKYCHDFFYRIENEEVKDAIKLFNRYGLKSEGAKAYDRYHIGIVD